MEDKFWKQGERDVAIERLRANQMGIISRKWRWDHVLEAFLDPKSWCWFFLVMGISYVFLHIEPSGSARLTISSIPSGGIGTFGPLIVQSFGFNKFNTILFNIP